MRTAFGNFLTVNRGICPIYSVFDYALNVRVIEGRTGLVTGLEIKYFTCSANEAAAVSKDISVLEPSTENESIGLRNIEGF